MIAKRRMAVTGRCMREMFELDPTKLSLLKQTAYPPKSSEGVKRRWGGPPVLDFSLESGNSCSKS
jgi:hypothetical protein